MSYVVNLILVKLLCYNILMELDFNLAKSIWNSDNGYRIINSFLIGSTSASNYKYHQKNNKVIEFSTNDNSTIYNTVDVINIIKKNMKTSKSTETYYRGNSKKAQISFIKKSFTSVTTSEEQANQFIDGNCCLYKVIVDPSVKRCNTGIEDEILLENDLYWEYIGKERHYHVAKIRKVSESNLNKTSRGAEEIESKKTTQEKGSEKREELKSWLDTYEEEYILFNDKKPAPEELMEYFKEENKELYQENNALIEELVYERLGGINQKKKLKTKKNRKPKRRLKPKRSLKPKRRSNLKYTKKNVTRRD